MFPMLLPVECALLLTKALVMGQIVPDFVSKMFTGESLRKTWITAQVEFSASLSNWLKLTMSEPGRTWELRKFWVVPVEDRVEVRARVEFSDGQNTWGMVFGMVDQNNWRPRGVYPIG